MTSRNDETLLGLREKIRTFLAQRAEATGGADPGPLSEERKEVIIQAAMRRYLQEEDADDFWRTFWKGVLGVLLALPFAVWGFLSRLRSPLPLDHPVTLSFTLTIVLGTAAACANSVSSALNASRDPLADRDLDKRLRAVSALEASANPERNAGLRRALDDPDLRVRRRAAEAVTRLRPDEGRVFLLELDLLRVHPDYETRARAGRAWQLLASYCPPSRRDPGDGTAIPIASLLDTSRGAFPTWKPVACPPAGTLATYYHPSLDQQARPASVQ
jgi:hypothetical protein